MKPAALVLAIVAALGAWIADLWLLKVPAFRNGWASLAFFAVPFLLLAAARGVEGRKKLKAAAWTLSVLSLLAWPSLRLFTGGFSEKPGIAVGDLAPDFMFKDQDGKDVRLSDLADRGRVVLVFFRGHL